MQLKILISVYKHNFIYLSETYLNSVTPDILLKIDGYNLVCVDHPDVSKEVDLHLL